MDSILVSSDQENIGSSFVHVEDSRSLVRSPDFDSIHEKIVSKSIEAIEAIERKPSKNVILDTISVVFILKCLIDEDIRSTMDTRLMTILTNFAQRLSDSNVHVFLRYNDEQFVSDLTSTRRSQSDVLSLFTGDMEDVPKLMKMVCDGAPYLRVLRDRIKRCIYSFEMKSSNPALESLKLYVCLLIYRLFLLGQMYTISANLSNATVANMMRMEFNRLYKDSRDFLSFLLKPTIDKATFFSLFHKSEFLEVDMFLREQNLVLPSLEADLIGKRFAIQPTIPSDVWMNMASNIYGTIWGTSCFPHQDRIQFEFHSLGRDNLFYISPLRWSSWYVYVHTNGYLYGSSKRPGDEGIFKIVKVENDKFMLSVLKWPGEFIYMSNIFPNYILRGRHGDLMDGRFQWTFIETHILN
ncbi:toxin CfTX-A-like [Ostrea edulis]|uniref:toxin CfTX-A-like n=1 Tax=Ostrea edulis TaxID=37623 RepID=UPI0024AFB320|nr:toxin CfTX-A-like [Ostrea edulis]